MGRDAGQGLRASFALKAFEMTARHDEAISRYFREQYASAELPVGRASPEDRAEVWCKPASKARAGVLLRGRVS